MQYKFQPVVNKIKFPLSLIKQHAVKLWTKAALEWSTSRPATLAPGQETAVPIQ